MSDKYILSDDGKTPVPVDLMTWAKWYEADKTKKIVAKDYIGDAEVSTVFLSLDHSFGSGPPVLWETMIFGGEHADYQDRYSTYEDALAGHARAVALVKGETGL